MAKIVFILGAGASKSAGAPLMKDFLDVAHLLLTTGQTGDAKPDYETVFAGINLLQRIHHKSYLDLENLEAVFVAFELAEMLGVLPPPIEGGSRNHYSESLRKTIVHLLEHLMRFPVPKRGGHRVHPPDDYSNFGVLAKALCQDHELSFITFNYDYALDFALRHLEIPFDYCFDGPCARPTVPLLKLHGSLNWYRPAALPVLEAMHPSFDELSLPQEDRDKQSVRLRMGVRQPSNSQRVIIPPTWAKADEHRGLQKIWQAAAAELKDAEHIVIVGYSLPVTDEFFRYLFALGTMGDAWLRDIFVINPTPDERIVGAYKSLFGPRSRSRFRWADMTFEDFASRCVSGTHAIGLQHLKNVIKSVKSVDTA